MRFLDLSIQHSLGFDFVLWSLGRILLQEGWTTPPFAFFSKSGDTKSSCKQIKRVQFSRQLSPLLRIVGRLEFSNSISHKWFRVLTLPLDSVKYVYAVRPEDPLTLINAKHLAPVVQRLDNAIPWINHYPVDNVVCFANTYPLDSDLSGG